MDFLYKDCDKNTKHFIELENSINDKLGTCQNYLDKNWNNNLNNYFYWSLWELYMCDILISSWYNLSLKNSPDWPDFLIEKDWKRIHIECVVANYDNENKEKQPFISYWLIQEDKRELEIRILNSIRYKYQKYFDKNYKNYVSPLKSWIKEQDLFYIAVYPNMEYKILNEFNLFCWFKMRSVFESLLWIWNQIVSYDLNKNSFSNSYYQQKNSIIKNNWSEIKIKIFEEYPLISWIFSVNWSFINYEEKTIYFVNKNGIQKFENNKILI